MNKFWLALAAVPAVAQASEYRTSSWFAAHPQERAQVMALCRDNAGLSNPNCANAAQGGIDYAVRDAMRHIGPGQSPDTSDYWRNPAHAQDLRYYKTQCERNPSAQYMHCAAIKAAGG